MHSQTLERPALILAARSRLPDPAWIRAISGQVRPVVVVDGLAEDGALLEQAGALVLRHGVALGVGRAMKTGINAVLARWEACPGVLLCLSEAQLPLSWLEPMTAALAESPLSLSLGISPVTEDTPRAQRRTRRNSTRLYSLISGTRIRDIGPVLRAAPRALLAALAVAPGEGEDYFLNMILRARGAGVPLREVELEPCYVPRSPLRPGAWFSIVWTAVRFVLSSLTSFGVDYGVFTLLYLFVSRSVTLCTVVARAISSLVNYFLNRRVVFRSQGRSWGTLIKYYILVVTLLVVNILLVNLLNRVLHIPALIAKPMVELMVYVVSYCLQRDVVFRRSPDKAGISDKKE